VGKDDTLLTGPGRVVTASGPARMSVQLTLMNDMLWHAHSNNLDTPRAGLASAPRSRSDHAHPNARDSDLAEVAIAFPVIHEPWVVVVQGAESADLLHRESCFSRKVHAYEQSTFRSRCSSPAASRISACVVGERPMATVDLRALVLGKPTN
jgi:hypothetical protein